MGVLLLIHAPTCFIILTQQMAIPLVHVRHSVARNLSYKQCFKAASAFLGTVGLSVFQKKVVFPIPPSRVSPSICHQHDSLQARFPCDLLSWQYHW